MIEDERGMLIMSATAQEKRISERKPFFCQAFFDRDGVIEKLQIKDFSDQGLGAYALRGCPAGQQGTLLVRHASHSVKRYLSEVMWCKSNKDECAEQYPYCLGLRILI